MKPIEKALLLRKSARLRSREPGRLFANRLREPRRVLRLVESSSLRQSSKHEARRQYLVAVCAAFESFWREFVRVNIDRHRVSTAVLARLKNFTFSIADVHNVVGRKLTLGELISCSFSFQGIEAVNAALSQILQINLLSAFSTARFTVVEVQRKDRPKKTPPFRIPLPGHEVLKRTCGDINKCYTIRHDTVHNTGSAHRVSAQEALQLENAAWLFCTLVGGHLEGKFDELWGRRPAKSNKRLQQRRNAVVEP